MRRGRVRVASIAAAVVGVCLLAGALLFPPKSVLRELARHLPWRAAPANPLARVAVADRPVAGALREMISVELERVAMHPSTRAAVHNFYRDRGFAPLWTNGGIVNARAEFGHRISARRPRRGSRPRRLSDASVSDHRRSKRIGRCRGPADSFLVALGAGRARGPHRAGQSRSQHWLSVQSAAQCGCARGGQQGLRLEGAVGFLPAGACRLPGSQDQACRVALGDASAGWRSGRSTHAAAHPS